jgi:hypothetical protein
MGPFGPNSQAMTLSTEQFPGTSSSCFLPVFSAYIPGSRTQPFLGSLLNLLLNKEPEL